MSLVSVEVIDAVQRTLEKEGLLQSIRAQLRSNVMKVLTSDLSKNNIHPNVKFAETPNGRIVLSLVRDLLLHLNMRQSLAVFDAESTVENFYDNNYSQMLSKLRLQSQRDVSLLEQLVDDRIHHKPIYSHEESSPRKQSSPPLQPPLRNTSSDTSNQSRRQRSPQMSPQQSPLSSPRQSNFTKKVLPESKSAYDESFEDEHDAKDSFEASPPKIHSSPPKSNYGIKDNLEDLIESLSPQKEDMNDSRDHEQFSPEDVKGHSITPGNIMEIKASPTKKQPSADDSMIEEIDEIIDSFEAEKEEEDEYDFNVASSSPPKPQLNNPRSPPTNNNNNNNKSKGFFAQDSSEEEEDDDDYLPPYGYVAEKPLPEIKKAAALSELPAVKAPVSGRLPFNASDFIEESKSDGERKDGDDSFAESPAKPELKKPLGPLSTGSKPLPPLDHKENKLEDSFGPEIEEEDEVEEDLDQESGPEYDSGDQEDADFSQLDHFMTDDADKHVKNEPVETNRSNVVQVQSSLRNQDPNEDRQSFSRAQVNRTQGSAMRSSKGWDVGSSDIRYDDEEDDEIDQLSSSPVARIPVPGSRRNDNRLDDMESSQLSIDDHQIDDSRHDDDHVMHTSYRSNQEEEEDNDVRPQRHDSRDDNDEFLIDHDAEEGKMHPEDHQEDEDDYEDEYDNDFADPDQSVLEPPVKAFTKITPPVSSSSKSNNNNNSPEDNDDDYGDDYEDGFEDDDNNQDKSRDAVTINKAPSASTSNNKRYAGVNDDDEESVDKEIESEIEEDEGEGEENGDGMSVGGQSESDNSDNGWGGKSKAKPSNEPNTSSMFKQRSGVLPTVNNVNSSSGNGGNRPTFSSLNDFSDDDDDDGLGAFSVSNRSSAASQPNTRYGGNNYGSNNNQRSGTNSRAFGDGSEENSVVSENLSVGGDNSGEESFSMND